MTVASARPRLECFFDCSSPWTYLGFVSIRRLSAELGEPVLWRPILVGGVFNAINPSVYESRATPIAAKVEYARKDLMDWADRIGLAINPDPPVFPINSVKAMRACIVMQRRGGMPDFANALFEAYWGRGEDISQDTVIAAVCARMGIDGAEMLAAIQSEDVKAELRRNTSELVARGGFGSPTFFVDGTAMFFGNDRIDFVRAALLRN